MLQAVVHGLKLTDPVCGRAVERTSPFQCAHGGALFAFCSLDCREKFTGLAADPGALAAVQATRGSGRALDGPPTGLLDEAAQRLPSSWLTAWKERRHAAACARDMLNLLHETRRTHSALSGRELYRVVVSRRTNTESAAAEGLLALAEESYARWPVERELNFRDVVHYIAVAELYATRLRAPWINANVKRVVESAVAADL